MDALSCKMDALSSAAGVLTGAMKETESTFALESSFSSMEINTFRESLMFSPFLTLMIMPLIKSMSYVPVLFP